MSGEVALSQVNYVNLENPPAPPAGQMTNYNGRRWTCNYTTAYGCFLLFFGIFCLVENIALSIHCHEKRCSKTTETLKTPLIIIGAISLGFGCLCGCPNLIGDRDRARLNRNISVEP